MKGGGRLLAISCLSCPDPHIGSNRVLNCSSNLKMLRKSNDTKLGDIANLKIMPTAPMQHYNPLIFIYIKISIFSIMVLMVRFLKYDPPPPHTLYWVISQFHLTVTTPWVDLHNSGNRHSKEVSHQRIK